MTSINVIFCLFLKSSGTLCEMGLAKKPPGLPSQYTPASAAGNHKAPSQAAEPNAGLRWAAGSPGWSPLLAPSQRGQEQLQGTSAAHEAFGCVARLIFTGFGHLESGRPRGRLWASSLWSPRRRLPGVICPASSPSSSSPAFPHTKAAPGAGHRYTLSPGVSPELTRGPGAGPLLWLRWFTLSCPCV